MLSSDSTESTPLDDADLLLRFSENGDELAFRLLVERHLWMVLGVALRKTSDRQLAEEIAQNAFAILARKAATLTPRVRTGRVVIGAWLHGVARIETAEALRREGRRTRVLREYTTDPAMNASSEPDPRPFSDALPALDDALASLKPRDRDVLMLRFQQGMRFREIAALAGGGNEDAARKRVDRALCRLRSLLGRRSVAISVSALAAGLPVALVGKASATVVTQVSASALLTASSLTLTGIQTKLLFVAMIQAKHKIALVALLCVLLSGGSFLAGRRAASRFGLALTGDPITLAPEVLQSLTAVGRQEQSADPNITLTKTQMILRDAAEIYRDRDSIGQFAAYYRAQLVLSALTTRDVPESLAFLDTLRAEPAVYRSLAQDILGLWSTGDGQAAMAWAEEKAATGALDRSYVYGPILRGWASDAPVEAYDWYQRAGEDGTDGMNISTFRWFAKDIFASWAARDPAGALAALDTVPVEDINAATIGIAETSARGEHRLAILDAMGGMKGDLKGRLIGEVAQRWAAEEPEAAAAWLDSVSFTSATERMRARFEVAGEWLAQDRGALMSVGAWLLSGAPSDVREEIIHSIARQAAAATNQP